MQKEEGRIVYMRSLDPINTLKGNVEMWWKFQPSEIRNYLHR